MQATIACADGMQHFPSLPARCGQRRVLCLSTELSRNNQTQVQQKVDRLVAIWDERKVFGQSGTKPFKELVTAAEAPKLPGTPSHMHALRDAWCRMGG